MREKIKTWYKQGLWTLNMVRNAVEKGVLTPEDYKDCTGEDFEV